MLVTSARRRCLPRRVRRCESRRSDANVLETGDVRPNTRSTELPVVESAIESATSASEIAAGLRSDDDPLAVFVKEVCGPRRRVVTEADAPAEPRAPASASTAAGDAEDEGDHDDGDDADADNEFCDDDSIAAGVAAATATASRRSVELVTASPNERCVGVVTFVMLAGVASIAA